MLIMNIDEKHVSEKILGYIMLDLRKGKNELAKVVERTYRHPQALEHAFVTRIEIFIVDEKVPPECKHAVHLLDHHHELMLALMNKHCQE